MLFFNREKNNQSRGQNSCFSARTKIYISKILIIQIILIQQRRAQHLFTMCKIIFAFPSTERNNSEKKGICPLGPCTLYIVQLYMPLRFNLPCIPFIFFAFFIYKFLFHNVQKGFFILTQEIRQIFRIELTFIQTLNCFDKFHIYY